MGTMGLKIAILGDVHSAFDERDVDFFNASDYDAILCVGDLPGLRHERAYAVAARMSKVRKPFYLIPGNHDATTLNQLLAEIGGVKPLMTLGGRSQSRRVSRLERAIGDRRVVGYSWHELSKDVGLIAARPHAMGKTLSFATYLSEAFGVRTMDESAALLKRIISDCPHSKLVFLAHNGPTGLGEHPTDIWGCDFKVGGGDWGDPDLREAISFAQGQGREVCCVAAGHMHQQTKQGKQRRWCLKEESIWYINAARVPRIFKRGGVRYHHHVSVTISPSGVEVEEQLLPMN